MNKKCYGIISAWELKAYMLVFIVSLQLASLIERDTEYIANLETLDNGKPYGDSVFDIGCAIDTFHYYAGWCDKIQGSTIPAGELVL